MKGMCGGIERGPAGSGTIQIARYSQDTLWKSGHWKRMASHTISRKRLPTTLERQHAQQTAKDPLVQMSTLSRKVIPFPVFHGIAAPIQRFLDLQVHNIDDRRRGIQTIIPCTSNSQCPPPVLVNRKNSITGQRRYEISEPATWGRSCKCVGLVLCGNGEPLRSCVASGRSIHWCFYHLGTRALMSLCPRSTSRQRRG